MFADFGGEHRDDERRGGNEGGGLQDEPAGGDYGGLVGSLRMGSRDWERTVVAVVVGFHDERLCVCLKSVWGKRDELEVYMKMFCYPVSSNDLYIPNLFLFQVPSR